MQAQPLSALSNSLLAIVPEPLRPDLQLALEKLVAAASEKELVELMAQSDSVQTEWAAVWSQSLFVAEYCARNPAFFATLIGSPDGLSARSEEQVRAELRSLIQETEDEAELMRRLRHFRHQHMCRIVWRDFSRKADTVQTVKEMTVLADACIDEVLNWLYPLCCEQWGTPHLLNDHGESVPQQMVVLGMGKLGAHELNVSSDIDLIFSFPQKGETVGEGRTVENQAFFIRMGQRLITILDKNTADGFVFRVDMRLRPYGQSGALALSFAAMEEYYQDQGREWERYAMIKARVVAGDKLAGKKLMAALRPFVYRKYIDFGAIESLRDMKRMISQEVKRKGMADNIKLGDGGIREVEFIAQAFQLIRGGRDTSLQRRELQMVLQALSRNGLLPAKVVDELWVGYCYLRDVEHAIQGMRDLQTQMLPKDATDRLRVAKTMSEPDWEAFLSTLAGHRARVSQHFASVITDGRENEQPSDAGLDEWRTLWGQELPEEKLAARLGRLGMGDAIEIASKLSTLEQSRPVIMMQKAGRERLDRFMPLLLKTVANAEHPGTTMERVLVLVESVLRRTAYLVLLYENPQALQQLVRLCAVSPWIAEQLATTPLLLDELLNTETLYAPPDKLALNDDLSQQLLRIPEEDEEELMNALRLFKKAHVLRVAASELAGTLPLMKVSDYLTWIAEVMLEKVVQIAWKMLVDKYGYPQKAAGEPAGLDFLVVGYGKLGGIELGYNSDLDLVFLHDVPAHLSTNGDRSVDNGVFFTRLGQKIIHILNTQMASGQLYEVDMRLRPSGNSGLLVSSLAAFEKYQQENAWTWEHQALVRARPVAGSTALAAKFEAVRQRIIGRDRDQSALRQEVREMRQKMRENLGTKSSESQALDVFHVKQDAGGIVDIEFIVQYCILAYSAQYPKMCQWSDNVRLLEEIGDAGVLDKEKTEALKAAYISLRSIIHKRALQNKSSKVSGDLAIEERELVSPVWQALFEEGAED